MEEDHAKSALDSIKKCAVSLSREVILSFYLALVKTHLECCVMFWAPHYEKDTAILK